MSWEKDSLEKKNQDEGHEDDALWTSLRDFALDQQTFPKAIGFLFL